MELKYILQEIERIIEILKILVILQFSSFWSCFFTFLFSNYYFSNISPRWRSFFNNFVSFCGVSPILYFLRVSFPPHQFHACTQKAFHFSSWLFRPLIIISMKILVRGYVIIFTCSDDEASSGFLSFLTRTRRGNRREIPFKEKVMDG